MRKLLLCAMLMMFSAFTMAVTVNYESSKGGPCTWKIEGKNILNVLVPLPEFAAKERLAVEELQTLIERGRKELFLYRLRRDRGSGRGFRVGLV